MTEVVKSLMDTNIMVENLKTVRLLVESKQRPPRVNELCPCALIVRD